MPLNLVLKVTISYLLPLQMPHTEFGYYRSRGFEKLLTGDERQTTGDSERRPMAICLLSDSDDLKMLKGTKNTSTTLWSYGVHFLLLGINYVDYRLECKLKLLWDI